MYQYDAQNTGSVDASPPTEDVEELWSVNVGDSINASPVVANETVYTLNAEGTAYAIEDGEILWSKALAGVNASASPTIKEDLLLLPHSKGLTALAREDGSQQWTYSPEGEPRDLTVSGDVVLFTDGVTTLNAVEAQSGDERWTATSSAVGASVLGIPAVLDGEAYVKVSPGLNREHGPIAKVNLESGYLRTAVQTEKPITTSLAAKDGMLFGGSEEGVHAFDIEGETLWHYETEGTVAGTPTVAGETVYCFTWNESSMGDVQAINLEDGSLNWKNQGIFFPGQRPMVVGNSFVYANSPDRCVCSLDKETGSQQWDVDGVFTTYHSMAYAMNTYYSTSIDGKVRAYAIL
ncbi:hypothetical protein GCM10028857_14410 [Salinarchaeum chitinilyticum]